MCVKHHNFVEACVEKERRADIRDQGEGSKLSASDNILKSCVLKERRADIPDRGEQN